MKAKVETIYEKLMENLEHDESPEAAMIRTLLNSGTLKETDIKHFTCLFLLTNHGDFLEAGVDDLPNIMELDAAPLRVLVEYLGGTLAQETGLPVDDVSAVFMTGLVVGKMYGEMLAGEKVNAGT